jgi:hypothetical protein
MEQAGLAALKSNLPDRMDERSPASPGSQDAPLGLQMDTTAPAGPDAVTGFPFGAARHAAPVTADTDGRHICPSNSWWASDFNEKRAWKDKRA